MREFIYCARAGCRTRANITTGYCPQHRVQILKLQLDDRPAVLKPQLYAAIADTHRNGGDSPESEAPFMSGSGARSAIAQGQAR